ncbi:MAG: GTP-binding protein [Acholeplasmatales bacterium]|nr:GTP-binding protein [Acholeplasmatales bacterium]
MRIDIISGFLGAGKTTFIKRLLDTNLKNEKVVLIENEYGEVSVDSDLLSDTKIEIKELSQGCICCSLVGDFSKSLKEIITKYNPDRILIEPSGVGKLSDIVKAVKDSNLDSEINSLVCMVDAKKAKMYDKNFGEFFIDQIKNAHTVILSRTDVAKEDTVNQALEIIRKHNDKAVVVTTPISDLSDEELLKAYEGFEINLNDFDLDDDDDECDDPNCECHHHHDHNHEDEHHHHHHHDHDEDDDDDEECECHNHHDHDHEHEHHHHHDHDEDECDDPNCECHHHHHADEVFNSIGIETVKKYDINALKDLLDKMSKGEFGTIVRAKGIIQGTDLKWYQFNLTPEEVEFKDNKAIPMGKIVVIGSHIDSDSIKKLF